MSKMHGPKECFVPIREDASQVIVSYEKVDDGDTNAFWYEVYFNKNRNSKPTLKQIKDAVFADINAQTDAKILNTFPWTVQHGSDAGKEVTVWLSKENQDNFKAKHDAALAYPNLVTFPMTYKISETNDDAPVYEIFESLQELATFYLSGLAYIEQCYNEGWVRKDSIDWTPYEQQLSALLGE